MARVSDGKTIRAVAPSGGVVKDEFVRVGKFHGFALQTALAGAEFDMEIDPRAVHRFAVGAGLTANKGDILYMASASVRVSQLTATATANFPALKVTSTKDGDNVIEAYAINEAGVGV